MELKHPHQLSVGDLVLGRHHDEVLMVVGVRTVNHEFYLRLMPEGGYDYCREFFYKHDELLPWVDSSPSSCCHASSVKAGDWLLVNQNEVERVITSCRAKFRGQDIELQEISTESAEKRIRTNCVPPDSFAMVYIRPSPPFPSLIKAKDARPGVSVSYFESCSQIAIQGAIESVEICFNGRIKAVIGGNELYFNPGQYLSLEPDQLKPRTEVKGHLSVEMILDA